MAKSVRIRAVCQPFLVESKIAIARIGPSSPHVPYVITASPTFVPIRPRSRRMGIRVPNAVVVRRIAMGTASIPPIAIFG